MSLPAGTKHSVPPAVDAAIALLVDDVDAASKDFERAIREHSFCWDEGGFGAINNRKFFTGRLNVLIGVVQRTIARRFSDVLMLARQDGGARAEAVESASLTVMAALADHCDLRRVLHLVFPAPSGRGVYLPPGLTSPKHERKALKHICETMDRAVKSELQRVTHETSVRIALHAVPELGEPSGRLRKQKRARSQESLMRETAIQDFVAMGLEGVEYCVEMDRKKMPIPMEWRLDGCPKTYYMAYRDDKWRKRIQHEKWRYSH